KLSTAFWRGARAIAAAGILAGVAAGAAGVDLATSPLFTSSAVKPNIMVLMDDSGSMDRPYLPDRTVYWGWPNLQYGFASTHCNYMAYNPAYTYAPPVDASGVPLPNASVGTYGAGTYYTYIPYSGSPPDMGFVWLANGEIDQYSDHNFY